MNKNILPSNQHLPLVSIGLPCFNSSKTIQESIDSVISQTYPNIELIISDNVSNDQTWEIIEKNKMKFPSINAYKQNENIGALHNFKFVLEHSRGEYFMWLAADDKISRGFISECMNEFSKNKDVFSCSGQLISVDMTGNQIKDQTPIIDLKQNSVFLRIWTYYSQVNTNSEFYSLFKRHYFNPDVFQNEIGTDWHTVAHYLINGKSSKIKNEYIYKSTGGISANLEKMVRTLKLPRLALITPILFIAKGAVRSIWCQKNINLIKRLLLIIVSLAAIFSRRNWIKASLKMYKRALLNFSQ